jgi:hypothetical protein
MPNERLSPRDRRAVLERLSRDRLGELTTRFELDVADRRSTDAHIDAIVRKRSLDFRRVLEVLRREELQAACEALDLDPGGREKATLVTRILGEDTPPERSSSISAPPPMNDGSDRSLKSQLRRFVLDAAGGYRGREASVAFTSRLLQCFGWPEAGPPETTMPSRSTWC